MTEDMSVAVGSISDMNLEQLALYTFTLLNGLTDTEVIIHFGEEIYRYIGIDDEEFQFFRDGNTPTNYMVKDLKEACDKS